MGVSSRFFAELAQQLGASIRISGGVTLISSEVWFCCPLWADRKGLQWRLVLSHSAFAFPQRLLQTGQSAPGQALPLRAHPGRSADFCHCSEADVRREVMNGEVWWEAVCPFLSGSDPNRTSAFGAIWPNATRPLRNGTSKTSHQGSRRHAAPRLKLKDL